ncbi:MAG: adenylate kinase [Gemmataceae bacterium]|nr:adenylate kinase [Gemmataceae bacterium]
MRLILLGPPGSGKGTQSKLLSKRLGLEHIGTGDLLRAGIRARTPVGEQARPFVEAGQLVPDAIVNDLVAERFARGDRPSRFVMDGYPRTVAQARAFDGVLERHKLPLTAVLLLAVEDAEIIQRLSGRWSCPQPGCKATYHVESNPTRVNGVCDDCGSALVQREDDKEETVQARLVVYHRDTAELIPYYRAKGLLTEARGQGEIEGIYNALSASLTS